MLSTTKPWVIRPLVPDEIYTDRQEFIDFFYEQAMWAATRRSMSTVLLGRRRMGKTEIFKCVVNRLFFEQDPTDPQQRDSLVVPVYYRFPDTPQDERYFAETYLENFLRHYVGFYAQQPELIRTELRGHALLDAVEQSRSLYPFTRMLDWILDRYDSVVNERITGAAQYALEAIRRVSDIDETTIAVFLDEFQNTRLGEFDVVGYLPEAVESPTCPHYVTGSAMSILAREIIGRGGLFGRFDSKPIQELSPYWGTQLALKSARYYQSELTDEMAAMVAERCGGNPFYINAVVRRAGMLGTPLINEEAI